MNAVKSTWRQLVRRRLWPVAVLLVAALAAVPVVLAREPKAPVPPAVPAETVTTKADDAIAEPVVAAVTPEDRARRRRVLGARKDPFRPVPAKKAKVDEPKPEQPVDTPASPADTGGSGGNVTVPAPIGPVLPVAPVAPVAPKKYYSPGTVIVRLSDPESDDAAKFAVKKLEPVPDAELPLLIYMGLTKDGKRAKFLVDASVEVDGDGTCKPHPSNCETIELSVGETEFLDVTDPEADADADAEDRITAQFQLDLVDIKRKGDADVK
jgi:hypothetical protein